MCFRCDSKFDPDHKCLDKALQILVVGKEDEEEGEEEEELVELDMVWVSTSSVIGITTPHTIKLEGKIRGLKWWFLLTAGKHITFYGSNDGK